MKEIQVYLTGRLGNQLFQYAMAKSIQKKYGGQIICNIYELEHRSEKMKHIDKKFKYDMQNFLLNENVKLIDKKLPWYADLSNLFIKIIKKAIPKLYFRIMLNYGYLIWQRDEYIEIPELNTEKITIFGWWQDFRFFENVEVELQNEIVSTIESKEENKSIYELAKDENTVCISIRGGNYLHPMVKKKLFVCDKTYFIDSIEEMNKILEKPKFVIFSDDLKWVNERFEIRRTISRK